MGHGHWSPTNFLRHSQAGQSSDWLGAATGSPGPTWVPVITFLSLCQSGSAMLQPCSLQDTAVWSQAGLFLHLPNSALNPMGKADSSPGSHWDPCPGLGLRPGHGTARTAAGRFIPSTGLKWRTQDGINCSFSQALRHNLLKSLGWGFPTNSALPPSAASRGNATVIYK